MKRKKVLYILHDIAIGGVEVALLSAIPELNRQFELRIMVLGKVDDKMTAHLTADEKSCLYTFDYPLPLYPAVIPKMISFILGFDPDVMICSLWRASMLGTIAKKIRPRLKFVSFLHNTAFFHRLDRMFSVAAIRKADVIFTDSNATADFVKQKFFPVSPVNVISFFTNRSPEARSAPPFDHSEVKFMFLGRINAVKNLPLAVDAVEYLRAKGHHVTLDIYGRDDGMLQSVLQYIKNKNLEDVIRFAGEVNAKQKQIAFGEHHFLIQLSANEGMAMSVAEAMQNGLVCFVTPVGEIPNYATDMKTAIFADISTPETFRESLEKLETVLRDAKVYNAISGDSYIGFKNVNTYSESLVQRIHEALI